MNELTIITPISIEAPGVIMSLEDKISIKEDEFICADCGSEAHEKNRELILDYHKEISGGSKDGIPDIEEIQELVEEYNYAIVYEIAELIYYEGGWDFPGCREDQKHEVIVQLADGYMDEKYWEFFGAVDLYIMDVLDECKLCYSFSEAHAMYEVYEEHEGPDENIRIIANDCQNILLEKIHTEGQSYFGDVHADVWRYQIINS